MRIGRHAHLPLHQLAGLGRQALEAGLVPGEGHGGRVHGAHPPRYPGGTQLDGAPLQSREAVEHAVEDQRGQRLHDRIGDRHVGHRGEVVVAALEVGHGRQAVVLVRARHLLLASDMEDDRDACLLGDGPDRIEPNVAVCVLLRAARGHEQGAGTEPERVLRGLARTIEVLQRHVAGRQKPGIHRTEVAHHPVVRVGRRITQGHVIAQIEPEVAQAERGEDELAREAQQIQRVRPILADEPAMRLEALAQQDVGVHAGAKGRVGMRRA